MTAWTLFPGDCIETLRAFPDACIDAVVTDPPYGLSKEPDMAEVLRHWLDGDDYEHNGGGFMGKTWDSFVPGPSVWREVFRVLKPGGHMLVFSGTRTYDLTVLAIRLAGFEIRDQLAWMYGTGFPKSSDFAKDHEASKRNDCWTPRPEFEGTPYGDGEWGTALKPAQEPIVLARKPLIGTVARNVLEHGTGGLNVDGCRVGTDGGTTGTNYAKTGLFGIGGKCEIADIGKGRWPANVLLDEAAAAMLDAQTGDLPAGVAVKRNLPEAGAAQQLDVKAPTQRGEDVSYGGSGGASRFFYVAKPTTKERERGLEAFQKASAGELTGGRKEGSAGLDNPRAGAGRTSKGRANTHPTVKPIALMRYLVRLITPPGGVVLDPFNGSGSTGCAAVLEGVGRYIGCELSPEYCAISRARIAAAEAELTEKPQ